ncbi:MAG: inositol monophosphatase [Myxococcus sp.]|nr:inositol monophosphatase [Myxococcus sp.]
MTPSELQVEAEALARAAGEVLRVKFTQARTIDFKGPGSSNLVTDADRAAERVVIDALQRRFPSHGLLTEESGAVSAGSVRWILDPLDGTTNYAHGVPHFCVSLAAEGPWEGQRRVLAAAVFDPMRDELFVAARGQGAALNGQRLQVSATSALDRALLCTGFPYDLQRSPADPLGLFDRLVRQARGMRRMGSAALELAYLAAGRFDGFFEFGLKPWDVAAGALLIEEAGGSMACLDGQPWDVRFGDVVAAGPGLFDTLRTQCQDFVAARGFVVRPYEPNGG